MTISRSFNRAGLFACVLGLIACVQLYAAITITILNIPHDMPLSIVIFRHSNAYPLMLILAAVLLFKRNGIAILFLMALLVLPLCDTLFSFGHRLEWRVIFDALIHGAFVWYCFDLIRKGDIIDPRESGLQPQYLTLFIFASVFQALYAAYFLFWPVLDGRNFASVAGTLPYFRWHVVFVVAASSLLVGGTLFLKNKKRSSLVFMTVAALAFGAQIIYYSYPSLITMFLSLLFLWFGKIRPNKVLAQA